MSYGFGKRDKEVVVVLERREDGTPFFTNRYGIELFTVEFLDPTSKHVKARIDRKIITSSRGEPKTKVERLGELLDDGSILNAGKMKVGHIAVDDDRNARSYNLQQKQVVSVNAVCSLVELQVLAAIAHLTP